MKASLKFREDHQKPLVRAKIPLNILGFPFQSGVAAGDSKELSLSLATFFDSGPCFKITYRPNDSWNPFTLAVKTGIGQFGSPISAPMSMSAEFSLVGGGGGGLGNPRFFVHFRPQIGDFRVKKLIASPSEKKSSEKLVVFTPGIKSYSNVDSDGDVDGDVEGAESSVENGVLSGKRKVNGFLTDKSAIGAVNGLVNGIEISARTVLPVRSRAMVGFRWGLRLPAQLENPFSGMRSNSTFLTAFRNIPILVMNKISIEHVAEDRPSKEKDTTKSAPQSNEGGDNDVARFCSSVKRELESLQSENFRLRRVVEDLRSEMGVGKLSSVGRRSDSGKSRESEMMNGRDKSSDLGCGFDGKVTEADVSEELKKVLMGAGGAGA